ncbi:predicted protein [Sclerotinia sclerotiorum 1980 UF-70]|uniref:Uncharacterized protein n=2 Tax=Sclerotinia sclerotiorum (strain ATCC 18683 / 1980 / Ss-1) TaxID=665079 RepID=A7ED82_SCLS1|nr:predicted protein [Sclerotinia sclerotiorum 1980 UF-70]APA11022.1 hypothetical protein sscle_07g057920 [Sclerotinia sclerotiorum 1980 UF-70]EDO00798.1 predicted protein [Sclerotinia sclerotiorum 1980 UF-70]
MSTPRSTKFNTKTSSSNPNKKSSSSTQRTAQSSTNTRSTNPGPPEQTEEQKLAETKKLNADLDALDKKFEPSFPKKSRFAHEDLDYKKYNIGGSSSPGAQLVKEMGRSEGKKSDGQRRGGSGSGSGSAGSGRK